MLEALTKSSHSFTGEQQFQGVWAILFYSHGLTRQPLAHASPSHQQDGERKWTKGETRVLR